MHMPLDGYLYHPRTHHVKLRLLMHNKKLKLALVLGHNFTLTWYFPWNSCFQTSFIFLEWLDQVDKARGKLLHISYNAKTVFSGHHETGPSLTRFVDYNAHLLTASRASFCLLDEEGKRMLYLHILLINVCFRSSEWWPNTVRLHKMWTS